MNFNQLLYYHNRKQIYVFVAMCVMALCAFGQRDRDSINVRAAILDNLTLSPVKGTKLYVLNPVDSSIILEKNCTESMFNDREATSFFVRVARKDSLIFRLEAEGYKPLYVKWKLPKNYDIYLDFYTFKDILYLRKLKNKDRSLNEVVVKATKLKFYYKGDTIVYNADAFELTEGSMLEDLIRMLPGTELRTGGQIYVNGRKVDELRLNGKLFFNHDRNVILENLPSYMVKNVKVFESENQRRKLMGESDYKQLSMDVRLKKQYSSSTISNMEAGAGTDDRYLLRLFALRFTKKTRLTLFGNLNNLSDSRTPGNKASGRLYNRLRV